MLNTCTVTDDMLNTFLRNFYEKQGNWFHVNHLQSFGDNIFVLFHKKQHFDITLSMSKETVDMKCSTLSSKKNKFYHSVRFALTRIALTRNVFLDRQTDRQTQTHTLKMNFKALITTITGE